MDWGSVAGLVLGLAGILLGQLVEGGHVGSLVQPAAFLVVFAGTAGAVLLQSGLPVFLRGAQMLPWAFQPPKDDRALLIRQAAQWSLVSRREGLLSLERFLEGVTDPYIEKGLRMLVDGIDAVKLRDILHLEIDAYETRQRLAVKVWESAGGYAPTIGILGAVLGLIHVMENLADPARLGSGIAVAFVATIYGVGLANLLFLPIANKLKTVVAHEVERYEMLANGFHGIACGENPRIIEERLSTYLD